MTWELFDDKTTAKGLSPDEMSLTLSVRQANFTVLKWPAIKDATHVLYYVDKENEQIGIKFVNQDKLTATETQVAYKILDQGYYRLSFNCRKLMDSLPFPLVDKPYGKWTLKFEWSNEQNMAIIKHSR